MKSDTKLLPSSIVLVDKPSGISSAQVVATVKRQLGGKRGGVRRIGHAGTLDPAATGLLICLINGATRLASYAEGGKKRYTGEIKFGVTTDTDDLEGVVVSQSNYLPTLGEIEQLLPQYTGDIVQIPPSVSAVKVNGKRAYALARAGERPTLKERKVTVEDFSIVATEVADTFQFTVTCSKGTYIRSLARDLGHALGCGGCLKSLCREASYPFEREDSVPLDQVSSESLQHWQLLFPDTPQVPLGRYEALKLSAGDLNCLDIVARAELGGATVGGLVVRGLVLYTDRESGVPLGLLKQDGKRWKFGVNMGVPNQLFKEVSGCQV